MQKGRTCLDSALHCDPLKTERASDTIRQLREGDKGGINQQTSHLHWLGAPLTALLVKRIPPLTLSHKKHLGIPGTSINIAGAIFNLLADTLYLPQWLLVELDMGSTEDVDSQNVKCFFWFVLLLIYIF